MIICFLKSSLFILLLSSIVVLRNRTGIVSILIIVALYLIKEYKFKRQSNLLIAIFLLIVFLLAVFGAFDTIIDVFWTSLTLNYDITNLDSLSAGRTDIGEQ